MNAIALRTDNVVAFSDSIVAGLPALVRKAAKQLESSVEAAELLDAVDFSQFAYDAGKAAARLAKKQGAYSEVISAAYRAQADALEIESQAKRRLADLEGDKREPHEASLFVIMNELASAGINFTERGVEFREFPPRQYVPTGIRQKR